MKKDISTSGDIVKLVDSFYAKIKVDAVLGPIFTDVAKVDWDHHLPKMYAFWGSLLLGEHSYSGNPMQIHVELSNQTTISEEQFSAWLALFFETLDELYEGEKVDEAKLRASNIARLMLHKIQQKEIK